MLRRRDGQEEDNERGKAERAAMGLTMYGGNDKPGLLGYGVDEGRFTGRPTTPPKAAPAPAPRAAPAPRSAPAAPVHHAAGIPNFPTAFPDIPEPAESNDLPVMPVPDDAKIRAAMEREIARRRRGRVSTILSNRPTNNLV